MLWKNQINSGSDFSADSNQVLYLLLTNADMKHRKNQSNTWHFCRFNLPYTDFVINTGGVQKELLLKLSFKINIKVPVIYKNEKYIW